MTAKVSALRPPSLQLRSIICSAPFIRTRMHPTVYFSVPRCNKIEEDFQFLPRDVMHKRGLRRHAVSVCLSVPCLPRLCFVSKRLKRYCRSCYGMRIGNNIQAFEWYHFNDLERLLTQVSRSCHFGAKYLRNSSVDGYSYNGILIGMPYSRVSFLMTLSDLE